MYDYPGSNREIPDDKAPKRKHRVSVAAGT